MKSKKSIIIIRMTVTLFIGLITGTMLMAKVAGKHIDLLRAKVNKYENQVYILNAWLTMKRRGCDILTLLKEDKAKNVVLCGVDALGRQFIEEIIENKDIEITEIVNPERAGYKGYISKPIEQLVGTKADAVIVNGEISEKLMKKLKSISNNIYTLNDLVYMCDWRMEDEI